MLVRTIPRCERPSATQLSAMRGKLWEDLNASPEFSVCGPSGSKDHIQHSGRVDKRRRFKGPNRFNEWRPCCRIFRTSILALDASPPGPLDVYERGIEIFNIAHLERYSILAFADETNRMEAWPVYREAMENAVAAGNSIKYWDVDRPWASVIWKAACD